MCVCEVLYFPFLNSKSKGQLAYWLPDWWIDLNLSQSWGHMGFHSTTSCVVMTEFWLGATEPRPDDFSVKWNSLYILHFQGPSNRFSACLSSYKILFHGNQHRHAGPAPSKFILRKETFLQRKHVLPTLQTTFYILRRAVRFPGATRLRHLYLLLGSLFYKLKAYSNNFPRTTDWSLPNILLSLHLARQKSVYSLEAVVPVFTLPINAAKMWRLSYGQGLGLKYRE